MDKILIGNSFPMSLIRRKVTIEPAELNTSGKTISSFWGHSNTIKVASTFLGSDLTPENERPVIKLGVDNFPTLNGETFTECWIISPTYKNNFRPAIGAEVAAESIASWQVLKITWEM